MNGATYEALAARFPYIIKWETYMQSLQYYREAQLERAAADSAPWNAIYYQTRGQSGWQTTDDITNAEIILEWRLKCPECGGTHAKRKGCNHSRHEVYAGYRRRTGRFVTT